MLRNLSLGKYNTKLYYGTKEGAYSTITGGFLTLIFAMIVIGTSFNILYNTFYWKNYTITTTYADIKGLNDTLKLKDFERSLFDMKI